MKSHSSVLILDYGSQYTQLITRRVRELGIYSKILPCSVSLDQIQEFAPQAIILSGGPNSVYDSGAPQLPNGFLEYQAENQIPVLGVCYGMQLLVQSLGGEVRKAQVREYGRMEIIPVGKSQLFANKQKVWMSHGDETVRIPQQFQKTAQSSEGAIAAIESPNLKMVGIQFHPEVTHTENGIEILKKFLIGMAGIRPDWDMGSVLEEQVAKLREKIGPKEHVICALSGGVDSTVAAVLVHQAIGERLHCFFIDHGLLRLDEGKRVMEMFTRGLNLPVQCLNHSARFLRKLEGVVDPEKKRKIIGAEFIASFEEAAEQISNQVGKLPKFLVQGTLYPDVVESSPAAHTQGGKGSGLKHSVTIKSHHNVGGLPENLRFELVEPFRDLFKDEVRELGKRLNIPSEFLKRHPFPGPGLAVRVIGDITVERLDVLRQCDEIFIESIREAGLYDEIWQAFAVFLPVKSVGVQGDGRTHDHVVALRAVTSSDGMTADWYPFDGKFLAKVSSKICNEVRGVNRVVYDISSKPPATIEWE